MPNNYNFTNKKEYYNNYDRGNYVKYTREGKKSYSEVTYCYTLNNVATGEVLPSANNKSSPLFFREKMAINKCKKINESLLSYNSCKYSDLYKVVKHRLEVEYDVYIPNQTNIRGDY